MSTNNHRRRVAMRVRQAFLAMAGAACIMASGAGRDSAVAQSLTGHVTSAEEGNMEGVVVSARKAGATVTVSVISDADGKFSFPAAKLETGSYALKIRAIGYELDGPKTVEVGASAAPIALKLRKTRNLAAQLSNGEWVMSIPGTPEQKAQLDRCTSCHTLDRPLKSTFDAEQFIPVLQRMGTYAPGSQPQQPFVRRDARADISPERLRPRADYLASINLSQGSQWSYELKTLPRLKGRSTRVVITEYDLPRPTAMPHDVILDPDGKAWYTDFGHQAIGKLDPASGKVTEYPVPTLKPGFPPGLLDIEIDKRGDLWVGLMLQAGIAKFERRSEAFTMYPLPPAINTDASQQAMVMPTSSDVDGKVWMNSAGGLAGIHRMDLSSKEFETFRPYKDFPKGPEHSVYGIKADSKNNLFFFDFAVDLVGRIDAKTGKISLYKTPTPNSNPRRGFMDAQDR